MYLRRCCKQINVGIYSMVLYIDIYPSWKFIFIVAIKISLERAKFLSTTHCEQAVRGSAQYRSFFVHDTSSCLYVPIERSSDTANHQQTPVHKGCIIMDHYI